VERTVAVVGGLSAAVGIVAAFFVAAMTYGSLQQRVVALEQVQSKLVSVDKLEGLNSRLEDMRGDLRQVLSLLTAEHAEKKREER
jgi:hypothetical protein